MQMQNITFNASANASANLTTDDDSGLAGPIVGFIVSAASLLFIALMVVASLFILQWLLVKAFVLGIKSVDKQYIGVDIDIEKVGFFLCTGLLGIHKFVLHNPEQYTSPYLLKADTILIDISVRSALRSLPSWLRGKGPLKIDVQEVKLQGVEAVIEYDGYLMGKSNIQWIIDFMGDQQPSKKEAYNKPDAESKHEVEAVYMWHSAKKHTFHFAPGWKDESLSESAFYFYAYNKQVPGTEPIYDFWHLLHKEYTFHFEDPNLDWGGEKKGSVQFYAFREQALGTEPVYDFWHESNREHTFHFDDPWPGEKKNRIAFYAYRDDPAQSGEVKAKTEVVLRPIAAVYAWQTMKLKHTFHIAPRWLGESIADDLFCFYAYSSRIHGTEPVYDFWDGINHDHTIHLEPARQGEIKVRTVFYAFREQAQGTQPIYAFWHAGRGEHTFHFDDPWPGEIKKDVAFYAYKEDPTGRAKLPKEATEPRINVKAVTVEDISAKAATKLAEVGVRVDNVSFADFSGEFNVHTWADVIWAFLSVLGKAVRASSLNGRVSGPRIPGLSDQPLQESLAAIPKTIFGRST